MQAPRRPGAQVPSDVKFLKFKKWQKNEYFKDIFFAKIAVPWFFHTSKYRKGHNSTRKPPFFINVGCCFLNRHKRPHPKSVFVPAGSRGERGEGRERAEGRVEGEHYEIHTVQLTLPAYLASLWKASGVSCQSSTSVIKQSRPPTNLLTMYVYSIFVVHCSID